VAARLLLLLALSIGLSAPAEAGVVPASWKQGLKRTTRAVSRSVSRFTLGMSARSRMFFDGVEDRLKARGLGKGAAMLNKVRVATRPVSPLALGGYLAGAIKSRPKTMKTFIAWRIPLDIARLVALPFLPAGVGAAMYAITGLPLDATYFLGAEYLAQRKAAPRGQKPGLLQTIKAVGKEYGRYRSARERKIAVAIRAARADGVAIAPATP
jgi:hypothetical protein